MLPFDHERRMVSVLVRDPTDQLILITKGVEAGERIGIVAVPPGEPWPTELPKRTDFWLFDLTMLYVMSYDPSNAWLGTERVTEPSAIEQARRWRAAALRLAQPWQDYIARHPQLTRIVSDGHLAAG